MKTRRIPVTAGAEPVNEQYEAAAEAAHVILAVPFALTGGVFLQWWLGYNFSVAVWVGYDNTLIGDAVS